ncbi:MAG: hypothetical protein KGN80_02975 [Acidobacteriota bacterium]|nr:hypothetical protein [Acidobacteriota bacterium]
MVSALGALGAAGLLTFSLACKSSTKSSDTTPTTTTATLSGKVTYARIPLVSDANGVPTGLETDPAKFKVLPLRGAQIRAYQAKDETNPDGTKSRVWLPTQTYTDSTGAYSVTLSQGADTFVEVISVFQISGQYTRVIADPNGINSSLPQSERVIYSVRKGADGTAPASNPVPGTALTANAVVNFDVGVADKLWITPSNLSQPTAAVAETSPTGSRAFAIGDSIYGFGSIYFGISSAPSILDLHYRPGISESRGSFIEFDKSKYPLSFDSGSGHYFGSLRGAAANDDAWDEGVLFPLMGRYFLYLQGQTGLFPPAAPLLDLTPDVAIIEGLAPLMAANALKSPYLADTSAGTAQVQDVRSLAGVPTAKQTVYSAPNIRALGWELILKANSIASPGTATTWATLNPAAMVRFFALISPSTRTDVSSIYQQIGRLKEAKSGTDPVDLATIFTDAALTDLTAPFQIAWPRPTSPPLNAFVADWGNDPSNSALGAFSLSMANAVQVQGSYPNVSEGEVAYARFALTKDTAYDLKLVGSSGPLPEGSRLEIRFLFAGLIFTFDGSSGAQSFRLVLPGNTTTPVVNLVRIRLVSPAAVVPDFTATVQLTVAN